MHKDRTQSGIYAACSAEGSFIPLAKMDLEQISGMLKVALADLETVNFWQKRAPKDSSQWNAIYKLSYDVFHALAEAFLLFDMVKAKTHECIFAYLCEKHPELEFDWNFLERIRTKRNRSLYYGEPASYTDWNGISLQIHLYISALRKAIEEKLKEDFSNK
jgi:hypothetical protein